jgi:hypothetical protein
VARKSTKGLSQELVSKQFREVYEHTPSTVTRAGVTGEKKRKMLAAVALSKARAASKR